MARRIDAQLFIKLRTRRYCRLGREGGPKTHLEAEEGDPIRKAPSKRAFSVHPLRLVKEVGGRREKGMGGRDGRRCFKFIRRRPALQVPLNNCEAMLCGADGAPTPTLIYRVRAVYLT